MKNVNGEEINEELFLAKSTEKLNNINKFINDSGLSFMEQEIIIKNITEYGMIMFHYGKFFEKTLTKIEQ